MNKLVLILALTTASSAFAAGPQYYEVCQGGSRSGATVTLVGNFDNQDTIEVNAQGERLVYNVEGVEGGDVEESYASREYGGLKVTFFDQGDTASGWSAQLGAFKLHCKVIDKR